MKKIVLILLTLIIANFCMAQAVPKKKKSVKKPTNTIKFTPPKIVPDEEVTADENVMLIVDSLNAQGDKPINEELKSFDTIAPPPPPPPPPPIPKGSVIKAKKLVAEFINNRQLASKKYQKYKHSLIVEGTVKDIKEADFNSYDWTIILDGSPASIDIECKGLSARKARKLLKGMKAIFLAHYEGIEDNIILSNCIYIENPTYE